MDCERRWYVFTGNNTEAYTIYKYILSPRNGGQFNAGCDPGKNICNIYACYGGINPDILSNRLQDYIARALANGTNQPPLGKRYVYTKSI